MISSVTAINFKEQKVIVSAPITLKRKVDKFHVFHSFIHSIYSSRPECNNAQIAAWWYK